MHSRHDKDYMQRSNGRAHTFSISVTSLMSKHVISTLNTVIKLRINLNSQFF
jgi:hypothetical protein